MSKSALLASTLLSSVIGFSACAPSEQESAAPEPAVSAPATLESSSPMSPSVADVAMFRELEVKLWEAWNERLNPADAAHFYSQDPGAIHFDFSPMKFTGWAEYERVASEALGSMSVERAVTRINDDLTLIKHGDLAVTAFTFHVDFYGEDGSVTGMDARETDVWVQQDGSSWVVAHQHMSFPSSSDEEEPATAATNDE